MARSQGWILLAVAVVSAACSRSSAEVAAPLAVATIGPAGGLVVVDRGNQRGLILEIPAGALAAPAEFRVLDELQPLAAQVGRPFRIEPVDLVASESMVLRVPYEPANVLEAGPGDVDVRQTNPWTTRLHDPVDVDPVEAWVEIATKTLGRFQVEAAAPVVGGRAAYLPKLGDVVELAGGIQFAVGEEGAYWSPLAGQGATYWAITGPGLDERLILSGDLLVGRGGGQAWVEEWSLPVDPLAGPGAALAGLASQIAMVTTYPNPLPTGATVTPLAYFQYDVPLVYQGVLYTDLAKVAVDVAYDRQDLGVGERQLTFWLSATEGLLRLAIDGVAYDREP